MSIKELSDYIPDMRSDKNLIYKVEEIFFIGFVSILCGAETWGEIQAFGKSHYRYFHERLPDLRGIPSDDTFNRFFSLLDMEWFEEVFRLWVDEICRLIPGVVAIDGKATCKNPHSARNGMKDRLYMVSAWSVANGVCLGQRKVDGKSSEIKAIPELIKALDLEGCIVTIDAIGCQKEITKAIMNAHADYILCVKDNHKSLREKIWSLLSDDDRLYIPNKQSYVQEDQGHGRKEYRECVCDAAFHPKGFYPGWEGIRTIAKITCTRELTGGKTTTETRCYISSLPQDPKLILESVRSHWQVENNLHWQLDVSFREDNTRKTENAAVNFSAMCKIALMMLKQSKIKLGMAGKRKLCGWDEKYRDQVMGIT